MAESKCNDSKMHFVVLLVIFVLETLTQLTPLLANQKLVIDTLTIVVVWNHGPQKQEFLKHINDIHNIQFSMQTEQNNQLAF